MTEGKILLVDDDIDLTTALRDYLQAKGFKVDSAGNVRDAWNALLKNSYDLLILDWDLPGGTGVELCRSYRDSGGLSPILMMTGRKEVEDKELGFESGADDYLTKPFSLREMLARSKSMLRRSSSYLPPSSSLSDDVPKAGLVVAGKYRLEETIGRGGMALVWRATDLKMNRSVVIKIMHGTLLEEGAASKRFEEEWRMLAKIKHPNIVTIYDAGHLNGKIPYLVMEYVKGKSLFAALEEFKSFSVPMAIRIMLQVCTGLQEVHDLGIIHRDLKPENILLQDQSDRIDAVKIADFGIARLMDSKQRLTREGMIIGTLEYISPEQLQDRPADGRADIYALGVILFELLTGQLPFFAATAQAMVANHLVGVPLLPSARSSAIPKGSTLDQIVKTCLEKDPANRFQNVTAMKIELEKVLCQWEAHP